MKYVALILLIAFSFLNFTYPKNMDAKIAEEIRSSLGLESFILNQIKVDLNLELPLKIVDSTFYRVESSSKLSGYLYYGQGKGKAAKFDYIVIFDKDLIIAKIKVMAYRESYGGEIGSKRWLKQFVGLSPKSSVVFKKDIVAISGATISASSLTREINKLLQSIAILKEKRIL